QTLLSVDLCTLSPNPSCRAGDVFFAPRALAQELYMFRFGSRRRALAALSLASVSVVLAAFPVVARGEYFFADTVVSYAPGSVSGGYQNSSSALGKPTADTGFGLLTPFNAAFSAGHMVGVGAGGSLTLHLAQTASANGHGL